MSTKSAFLKMIPYGTEAHHTRKIFNATYGLIDDVNVQHQFFEHIDGLLAKRIDAHTRTSLENLREDIESEIETGAMRLNIPLSRKGIYDRIPLDNSEKLNTVMRIMGSIEAELTRMQKLIGEILEEPQNVDE